MTPQAHRVSLRRAARSAGSARTCSQFPRHQVFWPPQCGRFSVGKRRGELAVRRRLATMVNVRVLFTMTRSEEHTSELQSLMRISYAVFCLKKKKNNINTYHSICHTKLYI